MRLPWPFGRRTSPDGPSPDSRAGAGPAAASAPRDTTARPTGAWASLPPIQRTVAAAPLVAPPAPFLDAVSGHRHLPPIVQPLGHEAGPSAPPGLVVARPSASPRLTSNAAMPVQRRAAHAPAAAEPAFDAWSPDPVADPAPVRSLATVTPAATVTPSPTPLTRAPASPVAVTPRASSVQRVAASATASRSASSPASASSAPSAGAPHGAPGSSGTSSLPAPRGTAPARRSRWAEGSTTPAPGLGAPPASGPAGTPGASPAAPGAAPSSSAATSPAAGAAPSIQRRAGIGSPLASAPSTAAPGTLPLATSSLRHGPGAAPQTAAAAAMPALPPGAAASAPAPVQRSLPTLPVARKASRTSTAEGIDHEGHGEPGHAPHAGMTGSGPAAVQRSASASARPTTTGPGPATTARPPSPTAPVRPIAGAAPLRPRASVQRRASSAAESGPAGDASVSAPVAARRSVPDDLPALVSDLSDAGSGFDAVPLQRLASTPSPEPSPAPPPMREITFPPPGTARIPLIPSSALEDAGLSPVQRSAAASTSRAGSTATATAHAPLALARPPAAAIPAYVEGSVPGPSVRRTIPGSITAGPDPVVQTSRSSASSSALPEFTVKPVVQREPAQASAPAQPADGGADAAASEKELDQLAQQLFGRLRTRLRAEVIQEREARGLGFDAF